MADDDSPDDFLAQASGTRATFVGELFAFLRENKKWWIAPILLSILVLGLLVLLGGGAAAPFIYTLF